MIKGLRKVVWSEGVFLGQQHLQQFDNYSEQARWLQAKTYQAFPWGVVEWDLNAMALSAGKVSLSRLQAVFPDGRIVDYRADLDGEVVLDLSDDDREALELLVMLPDFTGASPITGYDNSQRTPSQSTEYVDLPDQHDPARKREVLLAKLNIQLITERQASVGQTAIRLARLVKEVDGAYRVAENVWPPMLQMIASRPCLSLVQSLTEMLSARVRDYSERRKQLGDVASFSPSESAEFYLEARIVEFLTQARMLKNAPQQSPYELYQLLCVLHQLLAIHLSPVDVDTVPPYQHEAPHEALLTLMGDVRRMLNAEVHKPERKTGIEKVGPGRFQSSKLSSDVLSRYSFFLAVNYSAENPEWVSRFERIVKLGDPESVERMVAMSLPGVPVRHTQRVPQKIRIKSGFEYFLIDKNSPAWQNIKDAEQFGLFCMGEFADVEIELVVIEE